MTAPRYRIGPVISSIKNQTKLTELSHSKMNLIFSISAKWKLTMNLAIIIWRRFSMRKTLRGRILFYLENKVVNQT
jgi:hypothetical protein